MTGLPLARTVPTLWGGTPARHHYLKPIPAVIPRILPLNAT
ncbi:hypothetical protein [Thermobaculum terrenum]|nr:hypothetical protein [Thermobaculum terrenum]